ncbi:MAG: hypothetical protein LBG98_01695 [Puniceicoccales bacterium]|jgi:hypothetical protein|nr:hypothetical protein [Puniceicoccales bacterium]
MKMWSHFFSLSLLGVVLLWPKVFLGEKTFPEMGTLVTNTAVTQPGELSPLSKPEEFPLPQTDKRAIGQEVIQDETIIEGWARVLIQNALKCLNGERTKTASFLGLARGILFVVPDKLGTLLGVHVGSALGFYRKNDGYWGLPVVYQVESEMPIKWGETALLVIAIREEKMQASMVLSQWSCPLKVEVLGIADENLPQVTDGENFFWSFPLFKDFPKEMKLKFHFNREINEELYGRQNVRAVDIYFDPYDVPPCMKELCGALASYPQIKE